MIRSILYILIFLLPVIQHTHIVKQYKVDGEIMCVDKLGNMFTGNKDVLLKYNKEGVKLNSYSNKLLGEVTFLDVTNPLRYLAYYQHQGRVLFLDNTLSVHNEVVLEHYGFDQTLLACSSNNNSFWLYDALEFRLVRLNEQINIVQNSGNIIQLIGHQLQPNYLIEANDKVYLNDPNYGVFVFDIYGSYIKKIPLLGLNKYQIINDNLIYFTDSTLVKFNLKLHTEQHLNLKENPGDNPLFFENNMLIQHKDSVRYIKIES